MEYFSQRNGLKKSMITTYELGVIEYNLLLKCCQRYYDHISWKYPAQRNSLDINKERFNFELELEIPHLYRNAEDAIDLIPNVLAISMQNINTIFRAKELFDVYAILDFIEFMAQQLKDYTKRAVECGSRVIYIFKDSEKIFSQFRKDINLIFKNKCLLYTLNESKRIERVIDESVLSNEIVAKVEEIKEDGIRGLLLEAIEFFKRPKLESRHLAAEKIWDAFERLKTYYTELNKKDSADKLVCKISNNQQDFINLFNNEFDSLTKIGNNFCIRHHETNKKEIKDPRHYDYFFNRCLALIAHAIQYLK